MSLDFVDPLAPYYIFVKELEALESMYPVYVKLSIHLSWLQPKE